MGKVDQGVFTHWLLAHHFRRPLQYIGFGGAGKQVRDLLHVDDLIELLDQQLGAPAAWDGVVANVGGGRQCSLSLRETTVLCAEITGNSVPIEGVDTTRPGDVPLYISDCAAPSRHEPMASNPRPRADPVGHPRLDLRPRGRVARRSVTALPEHEANLRAACQ